MDIYAALKKDHRKVEQLLDQLVACSEGGKEDWKSLIDQIRDELIPHSRAEEALFYNRIRETEHGKDVVVHSYMEHAMAETELRTLQAMAAIDANFTSLAKKLREDILHHVEEEEGKVFSAAKVIFNDEEAQEIGATFESIKPEIREQSLAGTSLDLLLNILPEKLRSKVQGVVSKVKKKAA